MPITSPAQVSQSVNPAGDRAEQVADGRVNHFCRRGRCPRKGSDAADRPTVRAPAA